MSANREGVAAAILAGGLGTRLRSVVADRPKVLAEVRGQPFLAHLLNQLRQAGIHHVVLLTGVAADQVFEAFGAEYQGMRLTYSTEAEPLGTGGAIRLALPHLVKSTILLLNGDSFCDVDIPALIGFHRLRASAATLSLARVENASRYGRVVLGDGDRILGFEEKGPSREPGWINAGVYVLNRGLVEALPPGRAVSLEREALPVWITESSVHGFRAGRFIDIGTPESYAEAGAFFAPPRD